MKALLLGIGHEARGDDAVGPAVARALAADPPAGLDARAVSADPLSLLDAWEGRTHVIVVDALAGDRPGRVHHLPADAPLTTRASDSSHGLGLAEALALARSFGRLPARLKLFAIEGTAFDLGTPPCPAVTRAGSELVASLRSRFAAAAVGDPVGAGAGVRPGPGSDPGSRLDR